MKNIKSGFTVVEAVVIVVLVAVVIAGISMAKKRAVPTGSDVGQVLTEPTTTPTTTGATKTETKTTTAAKTDKTADWKTFSDNKVSFNYPAGWTVKGASLKSLGDPNYYKYTLAADNGEKGLYIEIDNPGREGMCGKYYYEFKMGDNGKVQQLTRKTTPLITIEQAKTEQGCIEVQPLVDTWFDYKGHNYLFNYAYGTTIEEKLALERIETIMKSFEVK